MRQHKHDYDAFISHAVEDKIPIANELCARLEQAGLRIWYSGKELGIGDSIEKTIENGLHRSRYGIVILSPTYLSKNWTIREFYTLLAKEIEQHKVILPVLYNITLDELKNKDLLMADRFAVNADRGIDYVVDCLVREIRNPKVRKAKVAWFSRIWLVLALSLLVNVALLVKSFLPQNAHDQMAAGFVSTPATHVNFLNEMQTLLSQLNTCTCDHSRRSGGRPFVTARNANQVVPVVVKHQNTSAAQEISMRSPGKMTMAVVFQIESQSGTLARQTRFDDGSQQEIAHPSEPLVESLHAVESSPFVTVNHSDDRDSQTCLHAGMLGE